MNTENNTEEALRKKIEKDNNAKKPIMIIILVSSFIIGGFIGVVFCNLFDYLKQGAEMSFGETWMLVQNYLTIPARVIFVAGDLIFMIVVIVFYKKAWNTWKRCTDEDERYERTEKYISIFLILVSMANCFNLSAFGVALYNKPGVMHLLSELFGKNVAMVVNTSDLILAIIPLIGLSLLYLYLQKKGIDLMRMMNPEKKGSVYDPKFHSVWYESCDEAERIKIGNASYKAYRVTNVVCCVMMIVFISISSVFEIGILPILIPAFLGAVMNLVYGIEAMKKPKLNIE